MVFCLTMYSLNGKYSFFTVFPVLIIDNGFSAVDLYLNLLPELYPESGALAHF